MEVSLIDGSLFALLAAFVYAIYSTFFKLNLSSNLDITLFMGLVGLITLILGWPFFIILHFINIEPFDFPTWNVLSVLILNGIFGSLLYNLITDICRADYLSFKAFIYVPWSFIFRQNQVWFLWDYHYPYVIGLLFLDSTFISAWYIFRRWSSIQFAMVWFIFGIIWCCMVESNRLLWRIVATS